MSAISRGLSASDTPGTREALGSDPPGSKPPGDDLLSLPGGCDPFGVASPWIASRWYRFARPPANGLTPSGSPLNYLPMLLRSITSPMAWTASGSSNAIFGFDSIPKGFPPLAQLPQVLATESALTISARGDFLFQKSSTHISTISRLLRQAHSEFVQQDRLMLGGLADAAFADLLAAARW